MSSSATAAARRRTRTASPARLERHGRRDRPNWAGALAAAIWLVVVGVPLYYLLANSFSSRSSYLSSGPLAPPAHPDFGSYANVLDSGFLGYLANTAAVTVGTVAIVLALAAPAAYAMVRGRSRGMRIAFTVMLMGLAVPAQATIIPLYFLMTRVHMYDSLLAIILPTAAFSPPMSVLVLSSTMRDIPESLYEAMSLDGATPRRVLRTLVLPLTRPGLLTVGIYTALGAWNGFLFPLVLTQSDSTRVLTLGLWNFQGNHGTDVPSTMAAVVLSMLPLLVLYLLGRRHLLAGLTAGFGR
ncbi:carbohydrate ABC transporter permease [Actinospica robiniae]|uniref:carbohydrate ABC transporter permease n=1 Tax=Actinospica robiniae TaxID=304901 RepID=UPI0004129750|nr:carbohydrate ABC transporter permease [Actinospica robiniae]